MDTDKLLEKLGYIKNSISDKEYNVAKLRLNLLIASIMSEVVACEKCGAETNDLCIHVEDGEE
jgi:hypothetical protein